MNVCFFCSKYLQLFMKIPLLYEINPFDNSVNPYSSISGHTFENWSSEKPEYGYLMILRLFRLLFLLCCYTERKYVQDLHLHFHYVQLLQHNLYAIFISNTNYIMYLQSYSYACYRLRICMTRYIHI